MAIVTISGGAGKGYGMTNEFLFRKTTQSVLYQMPTHVVRRMVSQGRDIQQDDCFRVRELRAYYGDRNRKRSASGKASTQWMKTGVLSW